jgi:hypothetical protein
MLDRENKDFETSNSLDVKYVDTEKKKQFPLLIPLLVMLGSLLLFFFYPFQIIGLIGSVGYMIYLNSKTEARIPKALVATGVLLSIFGLILGIAGIDDELNPLNILSKIQTQEIATCEGVLLQQTESCYADNAVQMILTTNQLVNELNIQIIGSEEIYSNNRVARIKRGETEQVLLAYNLSYYGEPTEVTVVPSIYGEEGKEECFESTLAFEISECE